MELELCDTCFEQDEFEEAVVKTDDGVPLCEFHGDELLWAASTC